MVHKHSNSPASSLAAPAGPEFGKPLRGYTLIFEADTRAGRRPLTSLVRYPRMPSCPSNP